MREFIPKNPIGFVIAIALYILAWNNLPQEQILQVISDPANVGGVAALAAGIAWTLRNEI